MLTNEEAIVNGILLIEPYGIEIDIKGVFSFQISPLLIEPYGIEIVYDFKTNDNERRF